MNRFLLLLAAAAAALVMAASATAAPPATLRHDRQVIAFFDHHRALAQTRRGERALWAAIRNLDRDVRDLDRQLQAVPVSWHASVDAVGHYFGSGVAAWEMSCSSTEGGWGGFVWYGHAASPVFGAETTPGGNMQFMQSTFDGVIGQAISTARARGMPLPSNQSAMSFYTPLGQALAGAQMYLDGRVGEWTGSGC